MSIENFFDLQRFADDTLVSDATGFTWKNGNTFAGRVSSVPTASIGTEDEPAHWDAKGQPGTASISGSNVYIAGDGDEDRSNPTTYPANNNGYTFGVGKEETTTAGVTVVKEKDWEVHIKDRQNVVEFNDDALVGIDGQASLNVMQSGINQGGVFNETVNGSPVYIKVEQNSDSVTRDAVSIAGSNFTGGTTYTFGAADEDSVALENGDKAIFNPRDTTQGALVGAQDVYIRSSVGAADDPKEFARARVTFEDNVSPITVTSEKVGEINFAIEDSATITISGDAWAFENKTLPQNTDLNDVITVVANDDNDTIRVSNVKGFTERATLTTEDLDTAVTVQGRAGYGTLSSGEVDTVYAEGDLYAGKRWDSIGATDPSNNGSYLSSVEFDVEGNATIETDRKILNGGRASVVAEDGAKATFDTITTDGVVVNYDVTVRSNDANASYVTATVEDEANASVGAGLAELATARDALTATISGDTEFKFTVNRDDEVNKKTYNVATTADNISLTAHDVAINGTNDVDDEHIHVTLEEEEGYSITGGDAIYTFDKAIEAKVSSNVTINSATVKITNNGSTADNYIISSKDGKSGVDDVMLLKANDAVSIEGDADGFTAVFDASTVANDNEVVTFSVNGATVSVKAGNADSVNVSLQVDSSGNILVTGIEEYDYYNTDNPTVVTVSGGTFYFGDKKEINKVSASTAKNVSITADRIISDTNQTIPTDKVVDDYRNTVTSAGITADDAKWNEISTIGSSTQYGGRVDDTVNTHHGNAYNDFYDLNGGNASGLAIAGYVNDQDTAPSSSAGSIQIIGDTVLGEATHVTLNVGSDASEHVGEIPINIQKDESDSVVSAYIDLTTSDQPSTVAIGTQGLHSVTASHEVHLSNVGTDSLPNYAYIGKYAVGENKLFGGDGVDMLRHEGLRMATINAGAGNDTIRGDVNDLVYGGEGADYFFDTAKYAADYKVEEGDVIVATRIKSFDELTPENIHGSGNELRIGEGQKTLKLSSLDPLDDVHIKVALLDDDGNILRKNGNEVPDIKNIVLANGNGTVDATYAGEEGAVVFANSIRGGGKGVYTILGSAGEDTIYAGNDAVINGVGGNDSITIDSGALNVVVSLGAGTGLDTVSGWNFGFGAQKTVLDSGDAQVIARVYEDMLHISLQGSSNSEDAILFGDTTVYGANHGQYDVLVGDKKYTAIRNNGDSDKGDKETSKGFASVTSNDEVADYYVAERDGVIYFDSTVTKSIGENGWVSLGSERFYGIRELYLNNSSKASVVGTGARETVSVGGAASVGANKAVSLGGENDVIYSGGADSLNAGHKFFFGAGDGRDTIYNYSHYMGVDDEPDKQHVDTIILQSYSGLKTAKHETKGDRIEIGTTAEDRVVIYEEDGLSLDKTYRIQVGFDADAKLAKIGNSEGGNNFQYSKKVAYYVGASGDAHDTISVGDSVENAYIRLDGQTGDFYRGIDVIDASANTNTNMSLAGSADNNTIIAGGAGTTNFLWGGAGDNSLIGGEGIDYFLYYYGAEGYVQGASGNAATKGNHDVIDNFNEEQDFIFLNDVTIDQIDVAKMAANGEHAGIATDGVRVDFKNGGSLTVNVANQDHVSFYLNNGAGGYDVYTAERSTGAWKKN